MRKVVAWLLGILMIGVPLEHKYDKLFRFYSLKIIPQGLWIPKEFDPKLYFYLSDLLAIALFCIALFSLRIPLKKLAVERGAGFLWIVFGCSLLSILASPMHAYPTAYFRLVQLLSPFLLCSLIANGGFPFEKLARCILGCVMAIGAFEAAAGIVQYFHQGPIGLHLLGEPKHLDAFFSIPHGSRWIFDDLLARQAPANVLRAVGTLPHPNVFGGVMALSLLASYPFWHRRLVLCLVPFLFFALCLSYSRSALFGWALGTAVWLFFSWKSMTKTAWVALLLTPLLSFSLLHRQILFRGGVVSQTAFSKNSNALRLVYQSHALSLLREKPLTGVGFQQYSYAASKKGEYIPAPHNIYLYLAAETGLLSLAAFLAFLFSAARVFWNAHKEPCTIALGAIFLFFLFVGGCDFYPLLFQQGKMLFFPLTGLLLCSRKREEYATAQ